LETRPLSKPLKDVQPQYSKYDQMRFVGLLCGNVASRACFKPMIVE